MITSENIQQTQSFLGIKDAVQQTLILKKESVKRIDHGVTLAFNTSFQRYLEIEHPSEKERAIVRDLLDKKIQVSGGKAMYYDNHIVIPVHRGAELLGDIPTQRIVHGK